MPQQPAPSDEIIPAAPASVIHELKYIDLLLLKTLAETESLTKTSARIGISVAKASRMLSSLRKLFNNELVQRCGPRMIATPTLERLLPDIRAALKSLGKLFEHPLAFHPADIESRLVFACTDNAYLALLAPALKRLAEEAPRLQRLSNWLPIELLHFDEGSQFLWTPEILWHERTDASPLHQWVRSIVCSAAAAANTP